VVVEGPGGTIEAMPFRQHHGDIESLGFRFGGLAYSSDVHDLPESSLPFLAGLDIWIVDALRYKTHPSHFSLEEALGWIERIGPKRAILTHMHMDLDYETLRRDLPAGVEPAFDRMQFELPG
jgi:phosphoribosyl 1,2-cyclic phosphate phosphodiesterase